MRPENQSNKPICSHFPCIWEQLLVLFLRILLPKLMRFIAVCNKSMSMCTLLSRCSPSEPSPNFRRAEAQYTVRILPQYLPQQGVFRQASVGDCPGTGVGSGGDQAAHGSKGGYISMALSRIAATAASSKRPVPRRFPMVDSVGTHTVPFSCMARRASASR